MDPKDTRALLEDVVRDIRERKKNLVRQGVTRVGVAVALGMGTYAACAVEEAGDAYGMPPFDQEVGNAADAYGLPGDVPWDLAEDVREDLPDGDVTDEALADDVIDEEVSSAADAYGLPDTEQ